MSLEYAILFTVIFEAPLITKEIRMNNNTSIKRKDKKGRLLRNGESQRPDGRYTYKYTNALGKSQFIYSWKLVATDRVPAGKRDDLSLREKVKKIQRDIDDGINTLGGKTTVCELYAEYVKQRKDIRPKTANGRKHLMALLENDPLGARSIDSVKLSDAKAWAIRLHDKGFVYTTILNYNCSLKASFKIALQDDCIRKNPFDFALNTILNSDKKERVSLTLEQEESLLSFVKDSNVYKKHYDEIVILLETGLRISELCGLTDKDIDFTNRIINVDHQLLYDSKIGHYIVPPKTKSGIRKIPMSEKAFQSLKAVMGNRSHRQPVVIDGYSDFLFLKQNGYPMAADKYPSIFKGIVQKHNKQCELVLPHTTPHVLRHTFCTKYINAGMNPKALQYIMGHSTIKMTLDYYTHTTFESASEEMKKYMS